MVIDVDCFSYAANNVVLAKFLGNFCIENVSEITTGDMLRYENKICIGYWALAEKREKHE